MKKYKNQMDKDSDLIEIGTIGSAIGTKGEVRLNIYSGSDRNIFAGQRILISDNKDKNNTDRNGIKELEISSVRMHKGFPVVRFIGLIDRNEVSSITGYSIFLRQADMKKLEKDEFYVKDLIGLKVYDIRSKKNIGNVKDVLTNTAQPIYVIEQKERADILLPGVPQFIKDIDIEKRVIEVELIAGFIEDEI